MKRKILRILGLLVLGASLLSLGYVKAAELQRYYGPSLQTLALKFIDEQKSKGNKQLFEDFEKLSFGRPFEACAADLTPEVAKIAVIEFNKGL